jgi:TetR/AcrR family transcriptional regulator
MAQATPTRGNAKAEPDGESRARAARSGAARAGSVSRAARSGAARAGSMFGSRRTDTADRILDATLDAFGSRGYGATSLDDLARDLGIRKQTILYWYPSKEALLDAAIDRTTAELTTRLERAVAHAGHGFDRVDAIVRAMFRLAARHPSMLGFVREVSRLGPPASTRLVAAVSPLVDRAAGFLAVEMDAGRMRRHEPRLILLAAYSMVTGLAAEVEVLRAFGEEPTLASLVRRRNELLALLRAALVPA